jgi:hypothetical protein
MQAGRNLGRQTDVQKDRVTNMNIQTYRNNDVQTYTDKQAERQCISAERQQTTYRCLYRKPNVQHSVHTRCVRKQMRRAS